MDTTTLQWILTGILSLAVLFLSGIYQEIKRLNEKIEKITDAVYTLDRKIAIIETNVNMLPCKNGDDCKGRL